MSSTPQTMRQSLALRLSSAGFLIFWCVLAAFPIFWISVMSFKVPIDAFAINPLAVIFGPETRAEGKGLSIVGIIAGLIVLWLAWRVATRNLRHLAEKLSPAWIHRAWLGIGLRRVRHRVYRCVYLRAACTAQRHRTFIRRSGRTDHRLNH